MSIPDFRFFLYSTWSALWLLITVFLMPRGKNGRNNTYYSSTSYPPSPPAQLPTPLPDEHLLSQHSALYDSRIKEPEVLSPLIDFETPTPPERVVSLPVETNFTLGSDIDNDVATSRSPPFREARLPQDSPPPLPIRPKSSHWTLDPVHQGSVEGPIMADDRSFVGHSRTPTFSRYVLFLHDIFIVMAFPLHSSLDEDLFESALALPIPVSAVCSTDRSII